MWVYSLWLYFNPATAGMSEEPPVFRANMSEEPPVFRANIPTGMYLSRGGAVNPRVFLQWGQEAAETLRNHNFSHYGLFEISGARTVFMRNLRLTLTHHLYQMQWNSEPCQLQVEAFNSHTGRTSFDLTLRWLAGGQVIATLVRKMVYMSLETGKPVELPAEFAANNTVKSDLRFDLRTEAPRGAAECAVLVRPSDIDFNEHVGHPAYMDYMLDSAYCSKYQHAPSDLLAGRIRSIDLEYRAPVKLGTKLLVQSWDQDSGDQDSGVLVTFVMLQAGWLGRSAVCLGRVEMFQK